MDLTKQCISYWFKDFRCGCCLITLFILLNQTCGMNYINNYTMLIWESGEFPDDTHYIKPNEFIIEISSISHEN